MAGERVWAGAVPRRRRRRAWSCSAIGPPTPTPPSRRRDGDHTVIAGICERLDGIPLAIELAAARVRSMTLADLADRLDDRFRLPPGRPPRRPGTPPDAAGDRAVVLPAARRRERLLFDRLAVFAGGFDLAAAEAVCADDRVDRARRRTTCWTASSTSPWSSPTGAGTHARYRLLETLRQFGEERLDEQAELAGLRDRHLAHYAQLAERTRQRYEGDAHVQACRHLSGRVGQPAGRNAAGNRPGRRGASVSDPASRVFFAHHDMRHEIGDWADQFIRSADATTMIYGVAGHFAGFAGRS